MQAAELLVAALEREGVEYVFGLPGEELEDLLFAIRDSNIEFIPTRHEQGAAFMANVHGRLTGEAGVCLATLGPGATNLLTGVADAHLDKAPLVAITGQGGLERLHQESHQALDVLSIYESTVKWNTQLDDPDIVPESVRKAFKLAEWEKPGATHLEFPEDVAATETEAGLLARRPKVRRAAPDPQSVDLAADLVGGAERPLVLAGNGAVRTPACDRLRNLVDENELPVVATYMGKGAVSDRSERSLYTLESGPGGAAADAVAESDCVLAVGYDIAEHDPEEWNPHLDKRVVHVDHEPAEVYEHYNPDVEVVADIAATLSALADRLDVETDPVWYEEVRERIAAAATEEPDADDPFTVANTLPLLRAAMADEDVLVSDVGSHKMAIAQGFPTYEPNTCVISNGLASMGIAVPGGVAADLAVDANVVVATGDGGFMMNAAEIETATRLGLGLTIVLFVDDEYHRITEEQVEHTGESFGTELTNPDFVQFAESFGIDVSHPESWDEVERAFDEAVPADDVSLVEIRLD